MSDKNIREVEIKGVIEYQELNRKISNVKSHNNHITIANKEKMKTLVKVFGVLDSLIGAEVYVEGTALAYEVMPDYYDDPENRTNAILVPIDAGAVVEELTAPKEFGPGKFVFKGIDEVKEELRFGYTEISGVDVLANVAEVVFLPDPES